MLVFPDIYYEKEGERKKNFLPGGYSIPIPLGPLLRGFCSVGLARAVRGVSWRGEKEKTVCWFVLDDGC